MATFVQIVLNHWQLNVSQHRVISFSEQTGHRIALPCEGKNGINMYRQRKWAAERPNISEFDDRLASIALSMFK